MRGIIPLNAFHVSKSLARPIRHRPFDTAFAAVMEGCAEKARTGRAPGLTPLIRYLYGELHQMVYAHSVEAWEKEVLVGGLYGISLGAAFFGESMFARYSSASKIFLVHLVERLRRQDFALLDTQFTTRHLKMLQRHRRAEGRIFSIAASSSQPVRPGFLPKLFSNGDGSEIFKRETCDKW